MSIISVTDLVFKYSGSNENAVDGISFEINEGDYVAIVGSNGSGKSTVARILSNLNKPTSGKVEIEKNASVGMVFQSPKDQIVSSIVLNDTSFGPKNLGLPESEIELRTIECLNTVDLLEKAKSSTSALSLGQTQKLALAGVLAIWPKVLVLDEAVAMLDPSSKKSILDFLNYWNRHGNTVIHITHDLDAVSKAKRVIGLKKGKIFFDGLVSEFLKNKQNVLDITGPSLPKVDKAKSTKKIISKENSLTYRNVFFCYKDSLKSGVNGINLKLKKGSLTALTGPSGAGKSTIMEIGAGLLKPDSGEIFGQKYPSIALQNCSDAVFETFAADDVAFGLVNKGIKGEELKLRVKLAMDSVNLPFDEYKDKPTSKMSGGELRRLALAGIIVLDNDVMFFDEPTAGLDGKSKYEVMTLLRKLAESGKTIVYSTHNLSEAEYADREIFVEKGSIVKDTINDYDFEEKENNHALSKVLENDNKINFLEKIRNTSLSLSLYQKEKKSLIERMPSAFRVFLLLLILVCIFAEKTIVVATILFGLSLIYTFLANLKFKSLLKVWLKVSPFIIIFAVVVLMFYPVLPQEIKYTTWKWLTITPSKLEFCVVTILKSCSVIAVISAFFVSTSEYDFVEGFTVLLHPLEVIHIPVKYFIVIMEIVFRFIPILVDEACAIVKTQIVRGALKNTKGIMSKIRVFIPLIIPLIIQSMKKSEALADAITIRCFK